MKHWQTILLLLAVLLVAAGLRFPGLASRPMHHDEANQAYRFGILLEEGTYTYDAEDHHGPTLYYLTLPIAWLSGADTFKQIDETTCRLLPVLFGMLLVAACFLLGDEVGYIGAGIAALLTALSPALVYYSRFYIQEIPLVLFTFLTLISAWKSWLTGSRVWAVLCGLSAGLMFATKETAVLAYAAIFGAAALCGLLERRFYLPVKNIVIALGCAVFVAALLFSSFFINGQGPLDAVLAFKGYVLRGTGVETDHVHPWYFYLHLLGGYRSGDGPLWSEGLIFCLGAFGAYSAFFGRNDAALNRGFARYLTFYTLLMTVIYSVLPYKTPWCSLSFLHGWIILAGIGAGALFRVARWKWIFMILFALAALNLAVQARRATGRYAADIRNPYVYAQTAPDFKNLIRRIHEIDKVCPIPGHLYIQVVADPKKTWPLPFYLRMFNEVGYWTDAGAARLAEAGEVIVASVDYEPDPEKYISEYYGLRADVLLALHIRRDLWDRFIETRK